MSSLLFETLLELSHHISEKDNSGEDKQIIDVSFHSLWLQCQL